ncbi:MAG: type II secretion system protein [Proteobacteria bacterium]|nr:type II secretion system protein [Pseudomonadota bacterium]
MNSLWKKGALKRLQNKNGFTYIIVLLAVVLTGISLMVAGKYWSFIDKKDKEAELLFRGEQYLRAIDSYFKGAHGGANLYPQKLDDLLKDPRSLSPKRYLRRLYKDPMTGEADWLPIVEKKSGRIKGLKSRSEATPVKEDGFPERFKAFKGKASYKEWAFIHKPGMFK